MEIDWIIFAGAVVLLCVPATLLYPAPGKDWLAQSRSARFRIERMLATWQNWFDFVRAFGGTFLLTKAAITVDPASAGGNHEKLALVGGVLAVAVIFQTLHHRKFFYFTAPIFFLWGLTLVLVNWPIAVFAIIFSVILSRLADHVELNLPLMAGLLGVAGYLVNGLSLTLLLTAVLIVLPVIIAFCSMQHLVCYSRDLAIR